MNGAVLWNLVKMRRYRHLSLRYVWNRSRVLLYEYSHPDRPWLTPAMIDVLDTWLQPKDVGLEFGSGRSTRWLAERVQHLTSIEHDGRWYATTKEQVAHLSHVDLQLHEDGATDASWESGYVNAAQRIAPRSLDFCLVDGVARDHCAWVSLKKLRPGGILIIDNVNWYLPRTQPSSSPNSRTFAAGYASDTWRRVASAVRDWRVVWTSSGVTDTAFWMKP